MTALLRRGRVLAGDGTPAVGALVWVDASDGPVPEIAIRAGREGRFAVALPPGRATLVARAPSGAIGRAAVPQDETVPIVITVRGEDPRAPNDVRGEERRGPEDERRHESQKPPTQDETP